MQRPVARVSVFLPSTPHFSAMRLRVVWNDIRLLIAYNNAGGSAKVSDLLAHIAAELKKTGVSFEEDNRFHHLSIGGFIANTNDLVSEVIQNDDIVEVTDYFGWIQEKRSICKSTWYVVIPSL
jgi:hypothetical protein